jgi:hypothetical protein
MAVRLHNYHGAGFIFCTPSHGCKDEDATSAIADYIAIPDTLETRAVIAEAKAALECCETHEYHDGPCYGGESSLRALLALLEVKP